MDEEKKIQEIAGRGHNYRGVIKMLYVAQLIIL